MLGFVAEIHNKVVDPDDLATMWRTDMANLFKLPVVGEVRINHQLNQVVARTHHLVDIDSYVDGTNVNLGALVDRPRPASSCAQGAAAPAEEGLTSGRTRWGPGRSCT